MRFSFFINIERTGGSSCTHSIRSTVCFSHTLWCVRLILNRHSCHRSFYDGHLNSMARIFPWDEYLRFFYSVGIREGILRVDVFDFMYDIHSNSHSFSVQFFRRLMIFIYFSFFIFFLTFCYGFTSSHFLFHFSYPISHKLKSISLKLLAF